MGEEKDNLKKYGTEAFVPESGESMSGNDTGMSTSISGNEKKADISISENGPVGRGEGQEGVSKAGVGYDGGSNEKRSETLKIGLRHEKMISEEEAKRLLAEEKARIERGWKKSDMKHKRILVTVVIVAAVLCIIGAVFAFMAGENKGNEEAPKRDETAVVPEKIEGEEEKKEEEQKALGELAVDEIYGYTIGCFEPGDGTFRKTCNIIELHTKNPDVILASYNAREVNGEGRLMGGGAEFLRFVGKDKICYLTDYIFGEYNFQTYHGMSCIDLTNDDKKPKELLVVESNEYNSLDDMTVVTGKYIYYHDERYGGDILRYDIASGELVNTGVKQKDCYLYYDGDTDVLLSSTMGNEKTEIYRRDDMLNIVAGELSKSDVKKMYPELYEEIFWLDFVELDITGSYHEDLYVGGKRIRIDEKTKDVYCDEKLIYDYPDGGNGSVGFRYDPAGKKAVLLMSDKCGGQTCEVFQTIIYDVESGDIEIKPNDLGYEFWSIAKVEKR